MMWAKLKKLIQEILLITINIFSAYPDFICFVIYKTKKYKTKRQK